MARGLLFLVLFAVLWPARTINAQTDERCFAETGFCISGPIRAYWEANGGLPVFGFPKTAPTAETVEGVALSVQWFERDRLEIQPDGRVTAGRLGAEILALQGTPWQFGTAAPPVPAGCLVFAETGHQVCGGFAAFWQANGGLERFGYPISGEFAATIEGRPLSIQYFERRRFEWHPDVNGGSVLLGLLGNDVISARAGAAPAAAPAPAEPAAPAPAAPAPAAPAAEQPLVINGNGRQTFQITVPFDVARVIMKVGLYGPWGMRVTNAAGEDELIFADRLGLENSGTLIGAGNTYNVEVKTGGPWTLTIRPFTTDQRPARAFVGTGMGASDYWYVGAGSYQAFLGYSGSGEGYFTVDLVCSSGFSRLIDRTGITSVTQRVPVTLGAGLCSWKVDALAGTYVLGMLGLSSQP